MGALTLGMRPFPIPGPPRLSGLYLGGYLHFGANIHRLQPTISTHLPLGSTPLRHHTTTGTINQDHTPPATPSHPNPRTPHPPPPSNPPSRPLLTSQRIPPPRITPSSGTRPVGTRPVGTRPVGTRPVGTTQVRTASTTHGFTLNRYQSKPDPTSSRHPQPEHSTGSSTSRHHLHSHPLPPMTPPNQKPNQ